jgi:hypothetical protein
LSNDVDTDIYRGRTFLLYKFNHLPRRFSSTPNSLSTPLSTFSNSLSVKRTARDG